jgi:two-component system, response regulator
MGTPILLVEDNPDDEALAMRAFAKHNLAAQVIVIRDGLDAIDYFRRPGATEKPLPRLVLLDLGLPRLAGLGVLRELRAADRTRNVPVVVWTSSREDSDVIQAYQLGANSYVRKPVDYHELVDAIGQLAFYWLQLNRCSTEIER